MLKFVRARALDLLALVLMVGLLPQMPACRQLLTFDVGVKEQTTVEGSNLVIDLLTVTFPDLATFDIAASDDFKNQGVNKEDVESVTLSYLSLRVVSPEEGDLSFFDEVSFTVQSEGLSKQEVAFYDAFEEGQREAVFDLRDVELRDYVAAESMSLGTEISARSPSEDTVLEVKVILEVVATAQGACSAIQESASQP